MSQSPKIFSRLILRGIGAVALGVFLVTAAVTGLMSLAGTEEPIIAVRGGEAALPFPGTTAELETAGSDLLDGVALNDIVPAAGGEE